MAIPLPPINANLTATSSNGPDTFSQYFGGLSVSKSAGQVLVYIVIALVAVFVMIYLKVL